MGLAVYFIMLIHVYDLSLNVPDMFWEIDLIKYNLVHVGELYLRDVYCTIKYFDHVPAKTNFIKHVSDNVRIRHTLYFHYFKEALLWQIYIYGFCNKKVTIQYKVVWYSWIMICTFGAAV